MSLRSCLLAGAALWLVGPAYAGPKVAEVPVLQNPVGAPGLGAGSNVSGSATTIGSLDLKSPGLLAPTLATPSPLPQTPKPLTPAAAQTDVPVLPPSLVPVLSAPPAEAQVLAKPGPAGAPELTPGLTEADFSGQDSVQKPGAGKADEDKVLEHAADAGAALFDGTPRREAVAVGAPRRASPGIASDIILASDFRGQLAKLEAMVPRELLETPGPLADLRRDIQSGFQELRAARERLHAGLLRDQPGLSPAEAARSVREQAASDPAQDRVLQAARELLARYDASLPAGEKLDFSSAEAFAASLEWSSRLHRSGGGKAFPFRFGLAARQAALAVRDALQAEIPHITKPEFEGVARIIGVLVMKDGTVYVAFSGVPETLRAVIGGAEASLEARLNAAGGRRFRVLPADTPLPEGLERVPDSEARSADNRFCAEKKLLAVLREHPALRDEVSQWAMLWRGDPQRNQYGTRRFPAFMLPCPHCVHNARVMLGGALAPGLGPKT